MRELLIVLMVWVGGVTGLPIPDEPPALRFEGEWTMRCVEWNDEYGTCPPAPGQLVTPPDVGAYFDPDTMAITLRDGWSERSPLDVAILVHELVHYMQISAKVPYECAGQLEPQAYKVDKWWSTAAGHSELRELDPLFLMFISTCGWEH